jgi:hypothetical protein
MSDSYQGLTSGYAYSLPVAIGEQLEGGAFVLQGEIAGTCFALGHETFLTAGHVASNLPADGATTFGIVGAYRPDSQQFVGAIVRDVEILPNDIALLQVEYVLPEAQNWFHRLRWSTKPVIPLQAVKTVGYAYGIQRVGAKKANIITRAFEGHVVAALEEFLPVGETTDPFSAYELSFQAPRGLSGAPLFGSGNPPAVVGMVLGNSESRMLIFRGDESEVKSDGTIVHHEQYEAMSLGLAVQAKAIFDIESRILNGTVGKYLAEKGLLI